MWNVGQGQTQTRHAKTNFFLFCRFISAGSSGTTIECIVTGRLSRRGLDKGSCILALLHESETTQDGGARGLMNRRFDFD